MHCARVKRCSSGFTLVGVCCFPSFRRVFSRTMMAFLFAFFSSCDAISASLVASPPLANTIRGHPWSRHAVSFERVNTVIHRQWDSSRLYLKLFLPWLHSYLLWKPTLRRFIKSSLSSLTPKLIIAPKEIDQMLCQAIKTVFSFTKVAHRIISTVCLDSKSWFSVLCD